jgi:uncharacterized protein (DUF342 family)
MRVYISYVRLGGTVPVTSDELKLLLKKAGVTFGVDDESVGLLAGKINSSSEPVGLFDVARGDPPKAGKDGWLELMAQPLSRDANYDADEDGNIDYHDLHLFENVIKGQVVAVVHEPGKGKPGVDVLGQYFPAADGKNASYSIGKNVREGDAPY